MQFTAASASRASFFLTLITLFTTLVSALPAGELTERAHRCASKQGGVHIVVAHGTTETGVGALGALADQIQSTIPGSTIKAIDYPAVYDPYQWSVDQGTSILTKHIKKNIHVCPDNRIVLLGYSQGGQVVMNTLCGTSEAGFNPSPPLDGHLSPHIASAIVYADPSHLAGQSYDMGSASTNGMFPRENPAACGPFMSKIKAYCDVGDPYCALGDDGAVHGEYFGKYDGQAANLAVSMAKANMKE